ncbi:MAG: hypothetical protein AVDCRST_MAG73-1252, partial [uncultured Thermomicrobiales bacterium]
WPCSCPTGDADVSHRRYRAAPREPMRPSTNTGDNDIMASAIRASEPNGPCR